MPYMCSTGGPISVRLLMLNICARDVCDGCTSTARRLNASFAKSNTSSPNRRSWRSWAGDAGPRYSGFCPLVHKGPRCRSSSYHCHAIVFVSLHLVIRAIEQTLRQVPSLALGLMNTLGAGQSNDSSCPDSCTLTATEAEMRGCAQRAVRLAQVFGFGGGGGGEWG